MGRYSLRDGKLTLPQADIKHVVVKTDASRDDKFAAPYIELHSPAKGASARYLYLGTAGALTISDVAPVGTSGAFADIGTAV